MFYVVGTSIQLVCKIREVLDKGIFIRLFGVLVSVARERKICGEEKGWPNILVINKCNKEVLLAYSSLSDHMYKDFIFCFSLPKTKEPG